MAPECLVIHVPKGCTVAAPLHVIHLSASAAAPGEKAAASPRMLVVVEEGGAVEVVEEFAGIDESDSGAYFVNATAEVFLETKASLAHKVSGGAAVARETPLAALQPMPVPPVAPMPTQPTPRAHRLPAWWPALPCHGRACDGLSDGGALSRSQFVVTDGQEAVNLRATLVEQQAKSAYSLTEVRLGGVLTRHDVNIVQLGPETSTTMRHFALCAREELHDLHTQLVLDHPSGVADQLHKCIVAHAKGQGVFDGNVQVNRGAQKTDAAQLCRNLLLVPRATVNVKPNLQVPHAPDLDRSRTTPFLRALLRPLFGFRAARTLFSAPACPVLYPSPC